MTSIKQRKIFKELKLADKKYVKSVYKKFSSSNLKKAPRMVDLFQILLDQYLNDVHFNEGITGKFLTSELPLAGRLPLWFILTG